MTAIQAGGLAAQQLRSFIERIEKLESEKQAIAEDIKEVKAGAKAVGFEIKAINRVLALRKLDPSERQELDSITDTYLHAIEGGQMPESTSEGTAKAEAEPQAEAGESPTLETAQAVSGDDDSYAEALRIVTQTGRPSISYLQRRLKVGYNHAADLMERMESAGIVSSPGPDGARQVLKAWDAEQTP